VTAAVAPVVQGVTSGVTAAVAPVVQASLTPPAGPHGPSAGGSATKVTKPVGPVQVQLTASTGAARRQSMWSAATLPAGPGAAVPMRIAGAAPVRVPLGFRNALPVPASAMPVARLGGQPIPRVVSAGLSYGAAGGLDLRGNGYAGTTSSLSGQSVSPLSSGSFGTGGRAAAGGFGLFFFGIAALAALGVLLAAGACSLLATTARLATPQPFISLLERPG
jgi:hypothetical protein